MSLYSDRVQETTTTTGTGTVTLLGAVSGYQSFTSAIPDGQRVCYVIAGGTDWEVGDGVFTASGTTLTRENVYSSSNAGALVSLSAITYSVWVDLPTQNISDIGMSIAIRNLSIPQ